MMSYHITSCLALVLGVLSIFGSTFHIPIDLLTNDLESVQVTESIDFESLTKTYVESIENGDVDQSLLPIILVPGFQGSALYASIMKTFPNECKFIAPTMLGQKFRIWVNLKFFLPVEMLQECFKSLMILKYDGMSNKYYNDNIDVETDWIGYAYPLAFLDYAFGQGIPGTEYMNNFLELARRSGYRDGVNLFSLPYDWRYPAQQTDWTLGLPFVEEIVNRLSKKVIIVGHSFGSNNAVYALNSVVTKEWKERNVAALISVAGALGGSVKTIYGALSNQLPFPYFIQRSIDTKLWHDVLLKSGSVYNLFPNPHIDSSDIVVVTNSLDDKKRQNYTASDLDALLTQESAMLYNAGAYILKDFLEDPGVPVICIWGDLGPDSTLKSIEYHSDDFLGEHTLTYGPGDGTLLTSSGSYCKNWKSTILNLSLPVLHADFFLNDHSIHTLINILHTHGRMSNEESVTI